MQQTSLATERRQVRAIGLNAAIVGVVDTSVLFCNAPILNDVAGVTVGGQTADWILVVSDANLGTRLNMLKRGTYHVKFQAQVPAAVNGNYGITLNATAAQLLAANDFAQPAARLQATTSITNAAANVHTVQMECMIPIDDGQIGTGAIIRFHGNQIDETVLVDADIDQATALYEVTYLGDLRG